MIVAASTSCITGESLAGIFECLIDLAYANIELVIGEQDAILPAQIAERHDSIVQLRRTSRRITPVSIFFDVESPPDDSNDPKYIEYIEQFTNACRLAKDCKISVITIHSAVHGTSFNGEIERLEKLVKIGVYHGVVVGVATETGHLTETPETILSLCKLVKGLGVTLDPSHYIYGLSKPKEYESILPHVCHVRLRDTSQKQFQTRIGQGVIDFSRLVALLGNRNYRRALCVDIAEMPDIDQSAELRKMRLLLECSL
jgi:sugar phosphate isomerase/epimerase